MPDELSDKQVSLLCDITDKAWTSSDLDTETRAELETLVHQGYAEPVPDNPIAPYRLTAKGMEFISLRGAGLNEA